MNWTSPDLAFTSCQSCHGSATFKQMGWATNMTASKVAEAAFTGLTAGLALIQLVLNGTAPYAKVTVTVNYVTP